MKDIPLVEAAAPNPMLAMHGGKPMREEPMPVRMALGDAEIKMLNSVILDSGTRGFAAGRR